MNYNSDDSVLTSGGHVIEGYAEDLGTSDLFMFQLGAEGSFKTKGGYTVEFVITDIKKDSE